MFEPAVFSVLVEKGTFSWEEDTDFPILESIDLKIEKGSLVAIVGPVGCGKSSLLSAVLGEMYKLEGRINTRVSFSVLVAHHPKANRKKIKVIFVQGSMAYVPQEAWIQNATLRDNICLLYTSPSPRDRTRSRMPSSA